MNSQPDLAAVCGKALAAIDGWLSDDDRALLRSRTWTRRRRFMARSCGACRTTISITPKPRGSRS